jgi:phage-related protein
MFDVDEGMTFENTEVKFNSGKKQVQRHAVNPVETWKITCRGDDTQRKTLKNFWKQQGGNATPFYFTDPDGNQRTVRFSTGTYSGKAIREFDITKDTHGNVVGFTAEITVELSL